MSWMRASIWKHVAAALALLGVLAYATLLPWHVSSRYVQRSVESVALVGLAVICHPGISTAASDAAADSAPGNAPIENETSCPVCKGLAAFSLAVLPSAVVVLPPREVVAVLADATDQVSAPARAIAAHSRGPPSA